MDDSSIALKYPVETGLVSVVIPTHNRAGIVGRAIASALAQTYPTVEVVVVDDGSTDATEALVGAIPGRTTYLYQANAGVAAARNAGIASSRGEFIAFLDSDDTWHAWKVEAQVAALRENPSAGLVWTDMRAVDVAGMVQQERYLRTMYGAYDEVDIEAATRRVGRLGDVLPTAPTAWREAPLRAGDLSDEILLGNLLHTSTVLFRRAWAERAGGFDRSYRNGCEDYEYYTRLCTLGQVLLIDAPSVDYRIGGEDQLTAPDKLLWIAQKNLATVRRRLAERGASVSLPAAVVRRRLAQSLAWVGSMEFEAGQKGAAARHLAASLAMRPRPDRRMAELACCALPAPVVDGLRYLWRAGAGRSVGVE
ncbi:MAG TPA: glycosyltransferase [Gemmatimonadaceae bacterium]|nr:glycosyltransferase [Gemmatimonadaceae bacterium]